MQLNSEDPDSASGTVTVSESFKKVTRTISLNKYRRTVKPAEGYETMVWKRPNYGNTGADEEEEDDEQEFYVEFPWDFNKPPIPSRAIHPSSHVEPFNPIPIPPRRSRGESLTSLPPDTRRDTLDNQYVVIQKPARKHLKSTADVLEEHSYVNVTHDNSRLRSITSPEIKLAPPKKERGSLPRQDSLEEVYI